MADMSQKTGVHDFQTIESILKLLSLKKMMMIEPYFQTIESILKHTASKSLSHPGLPFPDY